MNLVLYTHTDMKDMWPMCFGQMKKFIPTEIKVYVVVNKNDGDIPDEYIQLIYNDSLTYTERWMSVLDKIESEIILFLQEDFILLDSIDWDTIDKYISYVNNELLYSIKLIRSDVSIQKNCEFDETLITSSTSKLCIQPTVIKKNVFYILLHNVGPSSIWDFERNVEYTGHDYMVYLGNEKKRGRHHYDSVVFPFMSSAISKGKWNMSEYGSELTSLFNEYSIDYNLRGKV